jgi:hypothetical protein
MILCPSTIVKTVVEVISSLIERSFKDVTCRIRPIMLVKTVVANLYYRLSFMYTNNFI